MEILLISFLTAFTLTYMAIPQIIRIALAKNLCDEPDERRSHTEVTPSLGGLGIFSGSIFSIVLWTPFNEFGNLQYILCAIIILLLIGIRDDIWPVAPYKKMAAQIVASMIVIGLSGIRLTSLYGLFGQTGPIATWLSIGLSLLTFVVVINAFNLIDGIDGLAGSIGALITGTLGCWFYMVERYEFATVALATAGSIMAFLRYNYSPALIFMGDTGSLLIGLICALLVVKFIDLNDSLSISNQFRFDNGPAVAVGIIILPLFDTVRVFFTRMIRGHSPFQADRRHIHHLLIDYGFSHMRATGLLVFISMNFIVLVFMVDKYLDVHALLLIVLTLAVVLTYILHQLVVKKKSRANAPQV